MESGERAAAYNWYSPFDCSGSERHALAPLTK